MSFFGKKDDPYEPGKSERENKQAQAGSGDDGDGEKKSNRPSNARIAIWVIVGGIGLYLIGSGVYGILTH
jgi:hypothetical protein